MWPLMKLAVDTFEPILAVVCPDGIVPDVSVTAAAPFKDAAKSFVAYAAINLNVAFCVIAPAEKLACSTPPETIRKAGLFATLK
jgi:hypothetical protein